MRWEAKNIYLIYCSIHFIAVVWNQTHNIFEVQLYRN